MRASLISFGCAVCFGDPSSLSSKALSSAVFLLFGVVAFVLGAIACTAWRWSRRAKKLGVAENPKLATHPFKGA